MDQKSWLWKKRSSEKTLVAADKATHSLTKNDELTEVQKLVNEKTDLERDLQVSNEKLESALSDCNAKDNIAKKQVKIAEEAIAGWEKAESEAISLKQELDKVVQQKLVSDERIGHLDAALKECMHQLRSVRDEHEKIRIGLDAENVKLTKSLSEKDKVIEDLGKLRSQVEAELKALLLRVESTEKENASLKYEVRVLEKELDIRSEEREFNRRSADVARKQQQESAKKILDLETECQRLRLLVQKRLPGPASLARMRSEVETLDKGRFETRKRRSSPSPPTTPMEFLAHDDERINILTEQLYTMVEENRALKDALNKKPGEPQLTINEQSRTLSYRYMGPSDMNLMDDFAEMEKLAVVSVDYPAGNGVIQTSSAKPSISNSEEKDKKIGSHVSESVHKVLELLEGINIHSQDNGVAEFSTGKDGEILSYRNSENPSGFIVRVFQWKAAELSAILQQFVRICNDLLNGKADCEQFVEQVASNLEWIMNHCFSIQNVSSMKDAIRNHLHWDDESDSELDDHNIECNKLCVQTDDVQYPGIEEGKVWNVEWGDKESETECVKVIQESKDIVENLDSGMKIMEQSRENFSDQIEKQKMIKQDLETQLTETNHEWREACERISCLENELENKSHSCTRLEETCDDLKTQIQRMTSKDVSDNGNQREKQLQSDWEITAASEKLAECQETILNLGKQLKALASPNDAALFDKAIFKTASSVSTPTKNISRRSSLLNKMLADDDNPHGSSPYTSKKNQNGECYSSVDTNAAKENLVKSTNSEKFDHLEKSRASVSSLDIVPRKKNGSKSFFKKLFWPQKKVKGSKTLPS